MTPSEHLAKFHDTVAILVKAYLNDTLQHSNCHACAVGNLVADKMGFKMVRDNPNDAIKWDEDEYAHWFDPFWYGVVRHLEITESAQEQYNATGYDVSDLMLIEQAFESAESDNDCYRSDDESWMFNGLMSVVDVLASIHGVDLETTEAARKMFVKS